MKKILATIIAIILISIVSFSGCVQDGTGTLVLQITDAPGDLNITSAIVTISSVEVHLGAGGNNSSSGWYTIVEEQKTYDLVAIKDVKEFLGSENLSSGIYTQIRLHIDEARAIIDGIEYNLSIPSSNIKLVSGFWINESLTTTLTLDFDVNESIHKTGNDKYIFQPTIKVIHE
jgi:hypothetical protein